MTSDDERMSYPFRINMLKKAVKSIPELEIVSTLDEYNRVMYNATSTPEDAYDTYLNLLTNAAIIYDNKVLEKKTRRIQVHEQFADSLSDDNFTPSYKLNEFDNSIDPETTLKVHHMEALIYLSVIFYR